MALVADTVPAEVVHLVWHMYLVVNINMSQWAMALEKVIHLQCGPYAKQHYILCDEMRMN